MSRVITLYASQDCYTDNTEPLVAHNTTGLFVKPTNDYVSFVQFDLSGLIGKNIESVVWKTYAYINSSGTTMSLYRAADSWDEDNLRYSTIVAKTGSQMASVSTGGTTGWKTSGAFDLDEFYAMMQTNNGIRIDGAAGQINMYSSEGTNPHYLEVTIRDTKRVTILKG